jgi:hypothetical protein
MRKGAVGLVLLLACSFCGGPDDLAPGGDDGGVDASQGTRWQDLYRTYFGVNAQASCSQNPGACHRAVSDLGVATSGFVCGTTSDSCWQGMMQGQLGHAPIVPAGATDATQTPLWAALNKGPSTDGAASNAASNNMPQNGSYTFSATDLARIRSWIQSGAPNN